jgi:hypothetical protein
MVGTHGSSCQCDHDLANPLGGTHWLEEYVDVQNITGINEDTPGSCKSLFRPYSERLSDPENPCKLIDEDPDLIEEGLVIHIPFSCGVKLTGITVIGGENGSAPSSLRLFANLQDSSTVNEISEPSQVIDSLVEDFCGVVEYPLRPVRFSNVNSLVLQFPVKTNGVPIEINWIGLKGIASGDKRQAVVTVYESRANIADHEVKENPFSVSRQIQ